MCAKGLPEDFASSTTMENSDFDPIYQNQNIESKIVASLERISQAFRVLLWQESKDLTLTPTQIQVLIFLYHHHGDQRKVSYLAKEFNMTKATISDTVKALVQKELITKEYDKMDTRSYRIHLTESGRLMAERVSLFSKEIRSPLSHYTSIEKEQMLAGLMGIIRHLNQVGVISMQRMCLNCLYYQPGDESSTFYCRLLNESLPASSLRIDCPEHVPVA